MVLSGSETAMLPVTELKVAVKKLRFAPVLSSEIVRLGLPHAAKGGP